MALVNKTIPGLYGGVSQQAAELRHDTQVTEMINCYPSIIGGLQKRPPTQKIMGVGFDETQNYIPSDSFIYSYDRGAGDEQYLIVINNQGAYRVFDVITQEWISTSWTADDYLTIPEGKSPKDCFSLSTVGDTTFVVNKTKAVTASATIDYNDDEDWESNFYYWVKRTAGDGSDNASLRYTYYIRSDDPNYTGTATASNNSANLTDITASFPTTLAGLTLHNITKGWQSTITASTPTTITTSATNLSWDVGDVYEIVVQTTSHDSTIAATNLAAQINGVNDPHYIAYVKGSILKVAHSNGYKLTGSDSWGNQASESWMGTIKKMQDLPNEFGFENTVIKVSGDDNTNFDDFYVKYIDGVFKETFKPGLQNSLNSSTMPHKLELRRLTSTPTYHNVFEEIEWNSRTVGDDLSAGMASFLDSTIQDVFFYRNRLGFISGDNVILSESGEFYNFFPTTVTAVVDSDMIDVAVDSNKAISLRYALPYNKELLLFGDKAQFVMSAKDTLTPKNVSVQQSTAFDSAGVEPVGLGPNVYFGIDKDNFTSIREYYVQPDSLSNDAANVTAHCPSYIPSKTKRLVGSSKNDMLFVLTDKEPNVLYVYNFYWNGEEKAQSAWHKWIFNGVDNIHDMVEINGNLYLFTIRGQASFIEKINLESNNDISNIRYEDMPDLGVDGNPIEGTGVIITSSTTLTPVAFTTGTNKIDDLRNKFVLRNIQINADYGSFYNVEVLKYNYPRKYNYSIDSGIFPSTSLLPSQEVLPKVSSYSMSSDGKYVVSGKSDKLDININNELIVGFKINSLDFYGNFVQHSRSM